MIAPALPLSLAAPPPFPATVTQAEVAPAFVAPGVARADYRLRTANGPLVVHVVGVDPHEPTLRLGVVVAHDRLVSAGETVSSMARRSGAVAGINADYFDIGATNQPLNVVVRDGSLLRTPSARAALWIDRQGQPAMGTMAFAGDVRWDDASIPLTGVGIWPPQGGASLVPPAYGPLPAAPGVVTVPLDPVDPALGTYRVGETPASNDPLLAFGSSALALATPPPPGTTVAVHAALDPALTTVQNAVGGGPLLLRDGVPFDDPNAPAPEETLRRFPLAGAGIRPDGALLLVVVDGRRPEESVGLTRPQFGALLRAFGARDAMAFDSGGSSTLVARVLGDPEASVRNDPSDGVERPVADGLFVYSDAPRGAPDRLAFRPAVLRVLAGAGAAIEGRIVDAAGHAFGAAEDLHGSGAAGRLENGRFEAASSAFSGVLPVRAGALRGELPVEVSESLAALRILPAHPNPDPGTTLVLRSVGENARGDRIRADGAVRWSADGATIDPDGRLHVGAHDAVVAVRAGGAVARLAIPVGRHEVAQPLFTSPAGWRFTSIPHDAPGSVNVADGVLQLAYDLRAGARANYASTSVTLPGEPVALLIDVEGDGSGVPLRASFVNRYGEPVALTLAAHVDWHGWRRLRVRIPGELNPPVVLHALYVVPSLGGAPVRTAGTIAFRSAALVEPGTPAPPKVR